MFLDGAMGTMIQRHRLDEADFRGERFARLAATSRATTIILTLTRPEVIGDIHRAYLEAGADIIETNTFNSTAVSQADYGMQALVPELNLRGRAARAQGGRRGHASAPARPRFVAGALGPTSRTASLSPGRQRSGLPQRRLR